MMVLTNGGSPFWFLSVFALVAAARRWGFRETMATAVVVVGLSLAPASWPADARDVYQLLLGPTLLLLAGVLLAYIAQAEKRLRCRSGHARRDRQSYRASSRPEEHDGRCLRRGASAGGCRPRAAGGARSVERSCLVVGRRPEHQASTSAPRVTRLEPRRFESFMVAPAAAAWYAVRRNKRRERLDIVALGRDGARTGEKPDGLTDACSRRSARSGGCLP